MMIMNTKTEKYSCLLWCWVLELLLQLWQNMKMSQENMKHWTHSNHAL